MISWLKKKLFYHKYLMKLPKAGDLIYMGNFNTFYYPNTPWRKWVFKRKLLKEMKNFPIGIVIDVVDPVQNIVNIKI
jgi:phage pi2 protein 07